MKVEHDKGPALENNVDTILHHFRSIVTFTFTSVECQCQYHMNQHFTCTFSNRTEADLSSKHKHFSLLLQNNESNEFKKPKSLSLNQERKECDASKILAKLYHDTYGMYSVGLRFFSICGPWSLLGLTLFEMSKIIIEVSTTAKYNVAGSTILRMRI